VRPPTVLDTHVEFDEVDPDTSYDLTHRALTGRRLPRVYRGAGAGSTEPGPTEPPTLPSDRDQLTDPGRPPF
jgi:hypothetical protein